MESISSWATKLKEDHPQEKVRHLTPLDSQTESHTKALSILVVEDSKAQAMSLRKQLQSKGFATEVTKSGEDALAALHNDTAYDVVLSDVFMPGMSGYELCSAIKASPQLSHVTVLLLTTLDDPLDIIQALEARADNFISKPYEIDRLVERMYDVIANKHAREELHLAGGPEGYIHYLDKQYFINLDRDQILDFVVYTFKDSGWRRKLFGITPELAARHRTNGGYSARGRVNLKVAPWMGVSSSQI